MDDSQQELVSAFTKHFLVGHGFKTIVEARAEAAVFLGEAVKPGTLQAKLVDECIERGLVRAARIIARSGTSPHLAYEQLVDLYQRQPTLGTRSSTSIAQQAYSTPVPIAYLANQMAGIRSDTSIYEPTAGHGSLLLGSEQGKVIANELNARRAADLRAQGYAVTEQDATIYVPDKKVDVVIMNPPFGSVRTEDGNTKVFNVPGAGVVPGASFVSTQIDHAIALNALLAMKDDGRAVLILGGKMGNEPTRASGYNSQQSRAFYYTLYNRYNVTRHISVDGDLYSRQGAAFPIDLIVIEGFGKSKMTLPAASVPRIYHTFDELKELLPDAVPEHQQSLDANLDQTNDRRFGSGLSATGPNRDIELQRVSRAFGNADRMDDPAGGGSVRSVEHGEPLRRLGRNVLPSMLSAVEERTAREVGFSLNRGEPAFSGEAELRPGKQFPSDGSRRLRSLGDDRADAVGGMAPTDGSRTEGRLDVMHLLDKKNQNMQERETVVVENQTEDKLSPVSEQPRQVRYVPFSNAQSAETLVPANMESGMGNALSRLQERVGSLDEYVANRLNYGSPEQLHQYLNAEQVDAVALAISNLEKGRGFIIGDQTGVGKGRVVASVMRYAKETGRIPIFVTKDPVLYADMMRDLSDIDMASFKPFVTNADLNISLADGRQLKTTSVTHKREMQALLQSNGIGNYDAIFTTYSQMQSVKGQETSRRNFLRTKAPKAIIIMDESHEAGGTKDNKSSPVPSRSDFARELLTLSQGAIYSSATFAKRPDVMDLYALTDMGKAVSTEKLVSLVERGGIPMQQGLATMLTDAGQYIRRERSYEGVSFDAKISPVDKDVTESMSSIMAAILDFDRTKQQSVKQLDKDLKAEAKSLSIDNSTGGAGVDSTNFTSIMHNLVEQSLLALKAEATVQECLQALHHDEKPVIALASTMGSFIGDYAKMNDLHPGDSINLSFSDLLKRYLERSRDILVKDYVGNKTRYRLTDEELGSEGVAQYLAVLDQIDETDLSGIPISPIDYIKQRLTGEGYQVSEVTGRTQAVNYDANGDTTYSQRQTSKTADRNNIEAFNAGRIDVMILNRSGATGISLHASERFADQRQRHMLVVQPEKDINNFTQMLGRIHRTGQVVLPKFTLLMADIPAEKRPNAVLLKKMASLNANTTAARKSGISLDSIPDFLNQYGSQVVVDILSNNSELNYKLASPFSSEEQADLEKLIVKVTGRVPLLPLAEQEAFYNRLERDYQELVERQEAMGESILEATSLNLDARTIARMEVIPPDYGSNSPFTGSVYLEVVDAKTPRKPLTTLEVANILRNSLSLKAITEVTDYEFAKIGAEGRGYAAQKIANLKKEVEEYRSSSVLKLSPPAAEKLCEKLDKQFSHVKKILQDYPVGERVQVITSKENIFYGVVGRVWEAGSDSGNPVVPANWRMQILLADQARELIVPLSKANTSKDTAINIMPQERHFLTGDNVYSLFDLRQVAQRQERQIFTGNILRAYEAFQGKLVNFSDNQGKIRQGILTNQGFDIEKALESKPVRMPAVEDAKKFITEVTQRSGSVKTFDELLTIKAERRGDGFVLQTPKGRDLGGQYYLAKEIITAAGADFYSVGERMECVVTKEQIDAVLSVITEQKGLSLAAFDQRDKARKMLGIQLPKLELIERGQFEGQGNYVPCVDKPNPTIVEPLKQQFEANCSNAVAANISATLIEGNIGPVENAVVPNQPVQIENTPFTVADNHNIPEILEPTQAIEPASLAVLQVGEAPHIADFRQQLGTAEKNVAKLLHQAGLATELLIGQDFYLKVENDPYTPLSIERHGQELYLTHFLEDSSGDLFIDSEMVFQVSIAGQLSLSETAVQNPLTGGEYRRNDREFGQIFSKNLLEQGFASSALSAFKAREQPPALSQTEPTDVDSFDASGAAAQKLAAAFDGEVVKDLINIEPLLPKPEPPTSIPSTRLSNYLEPRKPLAVEAAQLSLFDLGLNNSNPPYKPERLRAESSPPVSAATKAAELAVQTSIQQVSSQAVRQDASHIVQEADVSSNGNGQQSKASPNLGVSPVRQHPVTERGESLSFRASQVRDVDLETVALDLGLERDKHDKHKWRGNGQIISINGQKFYDHLNQTGSGGAIDLVMHVQNCQYPEAVDWLSNQSATPQTVRDRSLVKVHEPITRDEPKYLAVPLKDETKWSDVQRYLTEVRGLPEPLIDHAHQLGLVYADTQRNAVFPRYAENAWERGEITGASLRGTRGNFHGLSPGSDKDKGWFWFGLGKGEVEKVVLVESAIDALSFAALDKSNHRENKTVYLSTDGAGAIPTADLQLVLKRGGQVVVAFDADQTGEQMAWKVAQSLPGVTRLPPDYGKDWNEQLLGNNQSKQSFSTPTEWSRIAKAVGKPESYVNRVAEVVAAFSAGQPLSEKATDAMQSDCNVYKQSLDSLWKWHTTANALGKPSQYLNRIAEVAIAFNAEKPSPLSAEAVATMQRDLNVQQVVTTSQKVLQHLGKPTGNENGELIFRGKNFYQVQGIPSNFKLESHDRGLILVVAQGRVQKSDLKNDDFERFHVLGEKLEADVIKSREVPVAKKPGKSCDLSLDN